MIANMAANAPSEVQSETPRKSLPLGAPAHIAGIQPYVPGKSIEALERELGIREAVKLASNENPWGPSARVNAAVAQALAGVHRYPDGSALFLRERLAAGLGSHLGLTLDNILLGNGSNELIDVVVRTFLSSTDHAVIGDPSFVYYPLALRTANIEYTEVGLIDHLYWDVDALVKGVQDNTRLVMIANPNNPTGTHLSAEQLSDLLKRLPRHVWVVIDEAYAEFANPEACASALDMGAETIEAIHPGLIVLRTFSKAYGLAGMRVGYAVTSAAWANEMNKVRAPFNVGSAAQAAALAVLDDREHLAFCVEQNREQRTWLRQAFEQLGFQVAPSQANFVLVSFGEDAARIYQAWLKRGIITRPMPKPIEGWLRVSVGKPDENKRAIEALKEIVAV